MNLFDTLPGSFFNCLASGSTNRVYADCLLLIYHEYDREITYRIPRSQVRDALAVYLMEHQVEKLEDEPEENTNYNEMANAVIRRFCSREVGWLEEDIDDATYEKHIMMTEQGVVLAEFLQQLMKPEREEFSSYIFNVYNILKDPDQWENDPYINGLRAVYRNAKLLSKALKRLATFIKKIIERMVQEETMESLTENILEYCEGDFIKEYARLTKQQNIHIYDELESTNQTAKKEAMIGKAGHGAFVIARSQTAGRGRRGREFYSPADAGLYISVILKPQGTLQDSLLITTAAAVAVYRAVAQICGIQLDIKWVNDLFYKGKKVCGILTEAVTDFESGNIEFVVSLLLNMVI